MSWSFRAKLVLAVVVSFFVFQLFLFLKSFPAEYNLYLRFLELVQASDPFWTSFWFASELVGEVGLIVRFAGACFAVVFAWALAGSGKLVWGHLRKAVLFEGAYYLFILPFIVSLLARPNTSIVNVEAALSYVLQIALVSTTFLALHFKLKTRQLDLGQVYRWGSVAIVGYVFALWVKHLLMNLYALPINLADPVLQVGLLNSAFTLLFGGLVLLLAFLPVIRDGEWRFNSRVAGVGFFLVGLYFLVYVVISVLNKSYLSYLTLTELWAVSFVILGLGLLVERLEREPQP